ncbi:MAG: extracellular solute-binding protein [Kiritimatiellae bacterium]|jgi:ABC-type glycerol-3-phosphate transport system substrate-binding protein|nr:extracellular solute-binding protein [Kiritimatiellia bacterium]
MIKNDKNSNWMNYLGLGILLICYVGAIWNVVSAKRQEQRADVIRLVHWQLELGVRDGLQELIEQFEAYKANQGQAVKVVQIPIPERAYTQYVTTQLIGGTAPDMIQIGRFPTEYLGRYFYPLSPVVQKKNPFLEKRLRELEAQTNLSKPEAELKTVLEDLAPKPWMDSFTDGLRSQFQEDFQEYFGVGFTTFTLRMFYNKDLFREIVGHDRAPGNYVELLDISRRINAHSEKTGRNLHPIASSKYQVSLFKSRFLGNLTANLSREFDVDFSGFSDGPERLMAMLQGDFTPWTAEYAAALDAVQQLATFFPKGFMALGREDSGFSFVQGKAAMITSGSWDALSFLDKIQNQPEDMRFEVGVFDVPLLTSENEQYGHLVDGRSSEASTYTAFAFGITRFTRHYDLCVEFLQFATTPERNTQLNLAAGWLPVIHGAVPGELMKNFLPNYVGYFGAVSFQLVEGGKSGLLEGQIYWPFISGDFDYETFAQRLWTALPAEAATDYKRMYEGSQESVPNRQLRRSAILADVVLGDPDPEARARREINLQRSNEVLVKLQLEQKRMDWMMKRTLEDPSDDPKVVEFNESFFKALNREMSTYEE